MPILFASGGEELLFIFVPVAVVLLGSVIIHYSFTAWKTYQEIDLKHEMVARGMSADEIERVLSAGK